MFFLANIFLTNKLCTEFWITRKKYINGIHRNIHYTQDGYTAQTDLYAKRLNLIFAGLNFKQRIVVGYRNLVGYRK